MFAGLLLTASFPWSSAGAAGAPSRPYGSKLCWAFVAGVSLGLLHLTVRREKQSQFICRSAAPFLWAFLCWYLFCNIGGLYFPLLLFWINLIIFIKKCYLWLLIHMGDANTSFLIWLLSYEDS